MLARALPLGLLSWHVHPKARWLVLGRRVIERERGHLGRCSAVYSPHGCCITARHANLWWGWPIGALVASFVLISGDRVCEGARAGSSGNELAELLQPHPPSIKHRIMLHYH